MIKYTYRPFAFLILLLFACENTQQRELMPYNQKVDNFIKEYNSFLKKNSDTCKVFCLFFDTNFKVTKVFINGRKNMFFLKTNNPLFHYANDSFIVFGYSGIENITQLNLFDNSKNELLISKFGDNKPTLYNPPFWCLNISKDTSYIDEHPSIEEVYKGTDIRIPQKPTIKFVPPIGGGVH